MGKNDNVAWVIIIVIVGLLWMPLFGFFWMDGHRMMGSSGFGYMSIISFLFPVFLISLILLTYKGISGDAIKEQPNPMAILKNRYAKGEITKKEYEEIKKELSG